METEAGFEDFSGAKLPEVTLMKSGVIRLGWVAYEALGRPDHVVLLFNQQERVAALKPAIAAGNTYPVRPLSDSTSYFVTAKAFCRRYGIEHTITRRYPATPVRGMLTFRVP